MIFTPSFFRIPRQPTCIYCIIRIHTVLVYSSTGIVPVHTYGTFCPGSLFVAHDDEYGMPERLLARMNEWAAAYVHLSALTFYFITTACEKDLTSSNSSSSTHTVCVPFGSTQQHNCNLQPPATRFCAAVLKKSFPSPFLYFQAKDHP